MSLLLETNNLSVGYFEKKGQPKCIHQNINVSLAHGEFACLLGPNGAGKSTLIKTLSGFIPLIDGEVIINGQQLGEIRREERSKTISVVLTEKLQTPNMTVFDVVSLGRVPYTGFFGRLTQNDETLVEKAIVDVGLKGFSNRQILQMSDGERQKVMIAKALVQDTPLIILDEPTAFLDLPSRVEIIQLLRKLAKEQHKAILLSTHDLDLALQLADKVWLLSQGKNLMYGVPEDLVLSDGFRQFFEKDGVLFDNESGSFKVSADELKSIKVVGTGLEYKWVSRALARKGFKTTDEKGDYPAVEISTDEKQHYRVTLADGSQTYLRTIEDLLEHICKQYDE